MSLKLRSTIGVLLSLLLLGWALRDVSATEVVEQLGRANRAEMALAVAIAIAGFYIRAFRWGILLLPLKTPAPFSARSAATFIGVAANNVLPARIGEFARVLVLARITPVPIAAGLATLVIERLLDGLVLVGLLFAAMAAPGFPVNANTANSDFRAWALVAAGVMIAAAAALLLAIAAPRYAARVGHFVARFLPLRLREPFIDALRSFAAGLRILTDLRLSALSLALALGQWVFLGLSYLLAFRAFGIDDVPFSGAIFLQSIIGLAVAIPSSPGFFGPFEAAARVGLSLWEVPASQAISFAIGFHIAGFLPVTLMGVWYVWRLNLSWSEVRRSEATVEDDAGDSGAVSYPSDGPS